MQHRPPARLKPQTLQLCGMCGDRPSTTRSYVIMVIDSVSCSNMCVIKITLQGCAAWGCRHKYPVRLHNKNNTLQLPSSNLLKSLWSSASLCILHLRSMYDCSNTSPTPDGERQYHRWARRAVVGRTRRVGKQEGQQLFSTEITHYCVRNSVFKFLRVVTVVQYD